MQNFSSLKNPALIIVVVISLVLVLVCGFILLSSTQTPTQTSPTNSDGNKEVVDYTLELKSFSFSPDQMNAEPGETIKVKLKSIDMAHTFTLTELGINETINAGESKTVQIKIPLNAGGKTYEFHCTMPGHQQSGMTGKLNVLDNR